MVWYVHACVVLEFRLHSISSFTAFLRSKTSGIFHVSILGTRHFDITSQGAEARIGERQIAYFDTPREKANKENIAPHCLLNSSTFILLLTRY